MYAVNLSRRTLLEHLFALKSQGLINEYEGEGPELKVRYLITDDGLNTLRFYNKSISIMDGDETTDIESWR